MTRNWNEARHKVDREGKCRLCKERTVLEAAHVVPRSLGGGMRESDVIPLCRRCHQRVDTHRCDWLHVLSFNEQAEAVRVMGLERARKRFLPSEYR